MNNFLKNCTFCSAKIDLQDKGFSIKSIECFFGKLVVIKIRNNSLFSTFRIHFITNNQTVFKSDDTFGVSCDIFFMGYQNNSVAFAV